MVKEHMTDEERLKELLVGKAIVKATVVEVADRWESSPVGYLTLDDGTVLKLWSNEYWWLEVQESE